MKRFISYGSINQFRGTVRDIQHSAHYTGYDVELEQPIMDRTLPMPTITVTGTEKIHGTNAAVCYSEPDGFWVQSRKNIITVEKDNAACSLNAYANEDQWMAIIRKLANDHSIDLSSTIISVSFPGKINS